MKKTTESTRRGFLKKGLAGAVSISVFPEIITKSRTANPYTLPKEKFIYRTLGKTGIKLPIISMGVMNANNPNLVKAALDAGIVHLDTAWYYQGGRNEEMIGDVIQGRPRDSYVIATKTWEPRDSRTNLFPANANSGSFLKKFDTSLKRLKLDHVDILYSHNLYKDSMVTCEPYLEAMLKLKKEGKVRYIGVSTHQNEVEVINTAVKTNVMDVILTSYTYVQKHRKELNRAIQSAVDAGLGIVGMKSIAGVVENIGRKIDVNAKAALKWAMQNENIHTNIPGFTTFEQMNEALSIMENLEFTPEEKAYIDSKTTGSSLYCQQCRECIPQCKSNLNIPEYMRSYMYVYGYRNLNAAKETLANENLGNIPCTECETCGVKCISGFNIKEKIMSVSRVRDIPEDMLI